MLEQERYVPYGEQRGDGSGITATAYKFTDQELDSGLGFYNYDARLYDPVIGRFVSADSVIPNWYDPQALNRYSYSLNNPVKYVDPDGHVVQFAVYAFYSYGSAILSSPDLQNDVREFSESLAQGDYAGAAFDAVSMGVPGLRVVGKYGEHFLRLQVRDSLNLTIN